MPDNNHVPDSGKVNEPPKTGNTEPIKRLIAQTARLFPHEEVGKGIRQVTLFFIFILAMFQHSWFLEFSSKIKRAARAIKVTVNPTPALRGKKNPGTL